MGRIIIGVENQFYQVGSIKWNVVYIKIKMKDRSLEGYRYRVFSSDKRERGGGLEKTNCADESDEGLYLKL